MKKVIFSVIFALFLSMGISSVSFATEFFGTETISITDKDKGKKKKKNCCNEKSEAEKKSCCAKDEKKSCAGKEEKKSCHGHNQQ